METIQMRADSLVKTIPISIHITGHRMFWFRNRVALRVLKWAIYLTALIGKNLDIEVKA